MTIKLACGVSFLENFMEYFTTKEKQKAYREQYGKVIKKKRQRRNISQDSLAEVIGVTGATMSRYEKGTTEMPASILPIICEACGFKFAEYMESFEVADNVDELYKAVRFVISTKGAYPPLEWDNERCKEEYDRLVKLLEVELKDIDCEEILVLGKILELLEKYKYENNDSMNELRLMAGKQLLSVLNGKEELVGLLSKTVALKARFTN